MAGTRKLSKDLYCDKDGIVHEYKHTDNRQQSIKAVRKSLNELCSIINANVVYPERCRWVTLTYAANMTDLDRLGRDWENFRKKAVRKWQRNFEYITIKEPQGRGAWHLHILMVFDDTAPFIDKQELFDMWGNGFVKVERIKRGIDSGLYFTASLNDMSVSDAKDAGIEIDPKKLSVDKKYVKGARLSLYKKGTRLYCCSKGISRPIKETMTKAQADLRVKGMTKVDEYSTNITDSEGRRINHLTITKYKEE